MKKWIPIVSAMIVLTIGLIIGLKSVAKSTEQYGERAMKLKKAGETLAEELERTNGYLDSILAGKRFDDSTKARLITGSRDIGNRLAFIRESCITMGFKNPRNMQWKIPDEGARMFERMDMEEKIDSRDLRALKTINDFYRRLSSRITKLNGEGKWGVLGKGTAKNSDWIEFYIGISEDIYESDIQRYFPYYN